MGIIASAMWLIYQAYLDALEPQARITMYPLCKL